MGNYECGAGKAVWGVGEINVDEELEARAAFSATAI
jgi:hypothetical protein